MLFVACFLAVTLEARGIPSETFRAVQSEMGLPHHSSQPDNRLRAQSEISASSRPTQVRDEPVMEGDHPIGPDKTVKSAVRLNAYPMEVQASEAVRLEAHVEPETEDLEFVFEFGDGERSERQSESRVLHRYSIAGTYGAFVKVYREGREITESQPVNITAVAPITHRLLLEANRTSPETTEPVRFTWRVEPPVAGVLYHIDFGDSYSGWVSEGWAEHVYRQRGEYRVLLRARIGGRDVQSNEILVTVKDNFPVWLRMVLAAAAGTGGVTVLLWRIVARARNRKRGKEMKAGAVDPIIVVRPHTDFGARGFEFSAPVSAGLEVRLQPLPDSGKQVMEQGMITRRRKEDNHG
jgi:hypothetical protein